MKRELIYAASVGGCVGALMTMALGWVLPLGAQNEVRDAAFRKITCKEIEVVDDDSRVWIFAGPRFAFVVSVTELPSCRRDGPHPQHPALDPGKMFHAMHRFSDSQLRRVVRTLLERAGSEPPPRGRRGRRPAAQRSASPWLEHLNPSAGPASKCQGVREHPWTSASRATIR